MKVIEAPNRIDWAKMKPNEHAIFLAGSIDQGEAEEWQKEAISLFGQKKKKTQKFVLLNPRRSEWDNTWKQDITNPSFSQQVKWELEALEKCHLGLLYFDPSSSSPISLLEFGLFRDKLVVVCPEGFWRKGNVDIVCDRYSIPQCETLEEAVSFIVKNL